jgi:hypothetical protein
MQRVVDDMCAEAAGDVFFSCPRVRSALNLCAGLEPPMIVAGHDVGRTVVDGARETHLITVSIPARAGFVHVTPPVAETAGGAFIRKRVYRPLRLPLAPGEYPPESFVGVTSEWSLEWGSVVVDYDPGSPNQALEIVASRARCAPPDELLRDIDRLCRAFPHVQHITATVLADKTDLLRRLTEFGFEVSAYLPAWYKGGVYRYDCVQLVKRGYGEAPVSRGLDDILNRLEPEIGSILTPARAAGRADRVARHRRS